MKKTKLTEVLGKLSEDEFREFGKFVNSPFFNEGMRLTKLYDVLKEYYPDFEQDDFSRTVIFEKLYPAEKYNDTKLRDGFSALFKLAEEYLSYMEFKSEPFLVKSNLLKALDKNGLDKFFEKYLNNAEVEINENKKGISDFFFHNKELKQIKTDFYLKRDKQLLICGDVIKREEYRIFDFILQLIDGQRDMIYNQQVFNVEFKGSAADEFMKCLDLEKFINYLKSSRNNHYPLLAMSYYLLKAIVEHEDESHLSNFTKLFNEFIDTFSRQEQIHFYRGFESYLITTRDIRSSNENERLSFGLYKQMLAKNLYSDEEEGYFNLMFFHNILAVTVILKEFTWLAQFIRDYIVQLRPDKQKDMQYLCAAYIEFGKGNFEKALVHIVKVNYEYFPHKKDVKLLMLKIYYELNSFEQLYSLIDTSKHFLSKTKLIPEVFTERYSNFIKFLGSLVKIKTGNDSSRLRNGQAGLGALKKEILDTKNVNDRDWLLEKIEELEGKQK